MTRETPSQFLQIKLRRPQVPKTLVPRTALLEVLETNIERSLTLISAPAGYGKSVLLSSWLEGSRFPSAWISLDHHDNDFRTFVTYFLASLRGLYPNLGKEVQALLQTPRFPPPHVIAHSLMNDLERTKGRFVLAMDDYHFIHEKRIHDLLAEFLRYPPSSLHLAIASRVDPPLPLATLRAKGQLTEIRVPDLRFSEKETADFLYKATGETVEEGVARKLAEKTEGWVTGLSLACLSSERLKDLNRIIENLPEKSSHVTRYLFDEILSHQPDEIQDYLLATSILDRFNAELCEAVCTPYSYPFAFRMGGQAFMAWLESSNLFVIPLDKGKGWVRYHHLFQEFLRWQLKKRVGSQELSALYKRASDWFAENGFLDEAIEYALRAGDLTAIAQLIEENRYHLMNEDRWYDLERWLSQVPEELIHQRLDLLLVRIWVLFLQFSLMDIVPLLEKAEALLGRDPALGGEGEIAFFKGLLLFWEGELEECLKHLKRALDLLPDAKIRAKMAVYTHLALASQLIGRGNEVIQSYRKNLHSITLDHRTRFCLMSSIIFAYMLSGELMKAEELVYRVNDLSKEVRNPYLEAWMSYFEGMIHYHWNDLNAAVKHFEEAIKKRYYMDAFSDIECYAGLIFSYQGMGRTDDALQAMEEMMAYARESENPYSLFRARSVQARLWLLRNDLASAIRWLASADFSIERKIMLFWLDEPRITRCRVQIAAGTEAGLNNSEENLKAYLKEAHLAHNVPRLIELWLLSAVVAQKRGRVNEALSALRRAVALALPGGYVRSFVELEPELRVLLEQTTPSMREEEFYTWIQSAWNRGGNETLLEGTKESPPQVRNQALPDPLSNREIEILSLLAEGLRNKEIANQLFISLETVKKHVSHIIRKLNAHNRQEAVSNAFKSGIL